jgi:hypothetical protein
MNKPARITVAAWPGLMSLDIAAAYCCFSERDFKKAVASGELPQPVLIDGKERWRLADLQVNGEEREEWRMSD